MTDPTPPAQQDAPAADPGPAGPGAGADPAALHVLEEDETVPPRPEEDATDELRARPDPH